MGKDKITQEENWRSVKYRIKEEGMDYCFEGYSDWKEIIDEEFHKLRKAYLESAKKLREYVNKKAAPKD
jgi:hypothetical protein